MDQSVSSHYERFVDRFDPPAATRRLIDEARKITPRLRARAAEAEAGRRVHDESIQEMRESGLFKLMQPVKYGGYGREFADYIVVAEELGAGCPSSAWIYANVILKSWMVPMFPVEAQEEVWGRDQDAIVSSILRPVGRSEPVEGGYRLSGTWPYVSGVDHTGWTIIGSVRQPRDENDSPEGVVHLVPRDDYALEDNWHVVGLAATGSKNIIVDGAFVPEHRTITIGQAQSGDPPGGSVHGGHPVYRVPLMSAFGFYICAPLLGIARGAVDIFLEHAAQRETMGGASGIKSGLTDLPTIQLRVSEALMRIDASRAVMLDAAVATIGEAVRDGSVGMERRIANRRAQSYSSRIAVEAVDIVFEAVGAGGLFLSEELQRYWRDAHAGAAHFGVNWDAIRLMTGQHAVGLEPDLKYF